MELESKFFSSGSKWKSAEGREWRGFLVEGSGVWRKELVELGIVKFAAKRAIAGIPLCKVAQSSGKIPPAGLAGEGQVGAGLGKDFISAHLVFMYTPRAAIMQVHVQKFFLGEGETATERRGSFQARTFLFWSQSI